jgi:ankyrin repeat protein
MPNFRLSGSLASSTPSRVALTCIVLLISGCAMSPKDEAYRDRLEAGFLTPSDIDRFRTPDSVYVAMTSEARSPRPVVARALDLELFEASKGGDVAQIKTLLTRGAQVNATDSVGRTPLLLAAREGETEVARLLIKAGADLDGRGGDMSPLAAAALRGHTAMVRLLLRQGADVNSDDKAAPSALMNAVKLNRLPVAKLLIEAGANTRLVDGAGDNLLVIAITENLPQMLQLLLQLKLEPERPDANGLTPLYWANYLKRPEMAKLLTDSGANPERQKIDVIVSKPHNVGEF